MTAPDRSPDRLDFSERLVVARPIHTLEETSVKTGIPTDVLGRLWRALGFPIPAPGAAAFNDEDLSALELMHRGSRIGLLDVDTEVRLARALGQTMTRLADWQVTTMMAVVAARTTDDSLQDQVDIGLEMANELGASYDELMAYAWRRHVNAAVSRMYAAGETEGEHLTITTTVGFADIVAFSALSNELDDDRIADLVEIFETRATDVVNGHGGRVIKTLGDSVLFVSDDPTAAVEIAHGIVDVIGQDSRLPDVRLGVATGAVILRFGDVFGPPVNLAARLTAIARRNRVITDEVTAGALSEKRFETRALTARPVRGFGVLEPIAVRRL